MNIPPINDLRTMAEVACKSGFYKGVSTPERALAKMLWGWELGIPPMASLTAIYVMIGQDGTVRSQPTLTAQAMASLILKSGYKMKRTLHTNVESKIEVKDRQGEFLSETSFTFEMAQKADLVTGPNSAMYRKYPANMLWSRNVSNIAKQDCADVFNGAAVYTPEELDAQVDENGNPIEDDGIVRIPSMRENANAELALRGEPPMPSKEEAKAAGVKPPSRTKEKTEKTESSTVQSQQAKTSDSATPATTSEPATKTESAPPAETKSSATETSKEVDRPGKAQRNQLLKIGLDKGYEQAEVQAVMVPYLKSLMPEGVPVKEFQSYWTWQDFAVLAEKIESMPIKAGA